MAKDKRFEVSLCLKIQEIKEEGPVPFFDNTLNYHELPYDAVVAMESMLVDMLNNLSDFGIVKAVELGLGDQLTAMGLGEKVAAVQK